MWGAATRSVSPDASHWQRCWEGWTDLAGMTQQLVLWSGSRGKERPGGLDLHSYWSSDGPSSLHYCFNRIWAMVHFPKDYAAAALNFTINLLKQMHSLY